MLAGLFLLLWVDHAAQRWTVPRWVTTSGISMVPPIEKHWNDDPPVHYRKGP